MMCRPLLPAILLALPIYAAADSTVVVHLEVQNRSEGSAWRIPAPGDYKFSAGHNRIRVDSPDGTATQFDFDKKTVSVLQSDHSSFYQMKLGDYLDLGDKVPSSISSRYSVKRSISFDPTVGQGARTILGSEASPYNLNLEDSLSRQSQQRGSGGGRRHGGFGFPSMSDQRYPGDPSGGGQGAGIGSTGDKIGGELWLSKAPIGDADLEQLNVAMLGVFMRGGPGVKALADRIKKDKLSLVGADFSVSVFDRNGALPSQSPSISAKVISVDRGNFDSTIYTIPSNYSKIEAPEAPLGSAN